MDGRRRHRTDHLHPAAGFTGNPTAVEYTAGDAFERGVRQTVTVAYLPTAVADRSAGNAPGSRVAVAVAANDSSNVVASTVRLVQGTALVTRLTVAVRARGRSTPRRAP